MKVSLPDASAGRVVVEQSEPVTPHDVGGRSGHFADDTLEFDGAARFVNLLFDDAAVIVDHFDAGNCDRGRNTETQTAKIRIQLLRTNKLVNGSRSVDIQLRVASIGVN